MIVCGDMFAFQRRDQDAPTNKGKLAIFGGAIEVGEDPFTAVTRELREETTIQFDSSDLMSIGSYFRPDVKRMQHLFLLETTQRVFDVLEGDGVEWYTLDDVLARTDISYGLRVACSKYREMKEDN